MRRCIFVLLQVVVLTWGSHADWHYEDNGPAKWPSVFKTCGGTHQSPVDLTNAIDVEMDDVTVLPFDLEDYYRRVSGKLHNNGHSVQFDMPAKSEVVLREGALPDAYRLLQFHFHWGHNVLLQEGSEHSIDGMFYPLEMHFVHLKTAYTTVGESLDDPSGLAVLGVMFTVQDTENEALSPLTDALDQVIDFQAETKITFENLIDLLPVNKDSFYRYDGSLTTPGCDEIVAWTVFKEPVPIGREQLKKFYKLRHNDKDIIDNFRPVQEINERRIFLYNQFDESNYDPNESFSVPSIKRK